MTRATDNGPIWSLYIIRCADNSLYTGISPDVERRLAEHAAGRGARYLRGRGPLQLIGSALVGSHGQALRVEYRFKRLSKSRKEHTLSCASALEQFVLANVEAAEPA